MNNEDYIIRRTTGSDADFEAFHAITENYYNQLVGGPQNRRGFIPGNESGKVYLAMIVYSSSGVPVACCGLKAHAPGVSEVKRVWVQPPFRGRGIAAWMMRRLEEYASAHGCKSLVLMTRERMTVARRLYESLGYRQTAAYQPYVGMDDAVCYAKNL